MGKSFELRVRAHEAWLLGRQDVMSRGLAPTHRRIMAAAVKRFNYRRPGHGVSAVAEFIRRWHQRLEATGTVQDKPGRGRKTRLTDNACREAVAILVAGQRDGYGAFSPFFDIEHPLRASSRPRKIMADARIKPTTLWRRLVMFDRTLKRKMMYFKPTLTAEQKKERVNVCRQLVHMQQTKPRLFSDYLRCTFWIDAKKMYLSPTKAKVVCSSMSPVHNLAHGLKSPKKQDQLVLYYYAVVNYFVGPVMIVFCTGTTRMPGERYKVYRVRITRWVCTRAQYSQCHTPHRP